MAGTTFYDQIAANRRNSFLMAGFVVALLALLGFVVGWAMFGDPAGGIFTTIGAVALGSLAGVGTYFTGDSLVLAVSGAREIDDQSAPQVMNVVREMATAANVPMPRVYIIEDTAPNAFATGRDPKHASVAVTTGLLQKLDREELQGVIGHELSHVRSGRSPSLPTSSCASPSGVAGVVAGTATAEVAVPRPSSSWSPSRWPSWPRSSAASSSSPSAASVNISPMPRQSS